MKKNNNIKIIIGLSSVAVILILCILILAFLIISRDREQNPLEPGGQSAIEEQIQEESESRPQLSDSNIQQEVPSLDSEFVFAGDKHWLFYKSTQDGDTMADYYNTNDFSEKEMETIAAKLLAEKKKIEKKGSKFVILIVPNKEVIYDQFMPKDMIRDESVQSRTDKLVKYLQQNTDIDLIYIKDKFLSMRNDKELIYYKTDTHWNMRGCYVAVQEIMQELYGRSKPISEIRFQEHLYDYAGDLVTKGNLGAEYNVDTVYFLGADQVTDEEKVEDSLLLVGDSFAEFMKIEMEYYFKGGVVDGNVEKYNYNFYTATESNLQSNPNVVVWECCERHISRLGK